MTEQQPAGMDPFIRRYVIVLVAAAAVGLLWWLGSIDQRVSELNIMLERDETVSAYPYSFRVLALENGVAEMSSPRSARMSAIQGLRILFPELQNESAVSPKMVLAQEELARVQSHAAKLVSDQADVRSVRWVLDEQWLAGFGVYVQ